MQELSQVYSRSLFEVAKEHGSLDEVHEQLGQVTDAIQENQDLRVYFFSPYFTSEEKKDGIRKVVEDADEHFLNFLELLAENHRLAVLPRIRREFEERWAEEKQLLPVTITSAVELDEETAKRVGDRIGEETGREVQLATKVDPELLAGLVIRVGNRVLDASLRSKLDRLRHRVARAT